MNVHGMVGMEDGWNLKRASNENGNNEDNN